MTAANASSAMFGLRRTARRDGRGLLALSFRAGAGTGVVVAIGVEVRCRLRSNGRGGARAAGRDPTHTSEMAWSGPAVN